METEEQGDYV